MKNDFKEYLDLRFTEKSKFQKKLLLSIHKQLKEGKIVTKSVIFTGIAADQNGKTAIIRKLLKGSKLEVLLFNDTEFDGKQFDSFNDMLNYVKAHDSFVVVISGKVIASNKELYDTSFKSLNDIITITKKKNSLIIFEEFEYPESKEIVEASFRFEDLFDFKIDIHERPPETYRRKYIEEMKLCPNQEVFDYLLKYTGEFGLSNFHSCITMLKALSKDQEINGALIKEAIVFMGFGFVFDENALLGINAIIGREELKQTLGRIIITYTKKQELEKMGINKISCYMFEGPPGTGKTFAVRCLSKELGLGIDHVNLRRLENDGRNASDALHKIFRKAMHRKDCILFIDEAEKLLGKEGEEFNDGPLQGELQQLIDGFDEFNKNFKGIIILNVNQIGTFSEPMIDRFEVIHFPTPCEYDRLAYLQNKLGLLGKNISEALLSEITLEELSEDTEGRSYREIDRLWAEIVLHKLEEPSAANAKSVREKLKCIAIDEPNYFG